MISTPSACIVAEKEKDGKSGSDAGRSSACKIYCRKISGKSGNYLTPFVICTVTQVLTKENASP